MRWEGEPKGSGRRSVAIPLTRIHIPHRRSAERGEGRGTVGYPPFRVCLCATVGSLLLYSFQSGYGDLATRPARRVGVGGEGDRDRGGPPSPYIISSPERVAIISRQWLTDRSASQKGPGPIIAATHRPRRSGQSWGPCAFSFAFFPPRTNSFLPRRDPRRRLLDVSRTGKRRRLKQVIPEESVYQTFHDANRIEQFLWIYGNEKNYVLLTLHMYMMLRYISLYLTHKTTHTCTADFILLYLLI